MNIVPRRARQLRQSGISLVPVKIDGSKQVALTSWKQYQKQHPCTAEDVDEWFDNADPYGIGVICGEVSGNLEVIDIDDATLIEPIEETLQSEYPDLYEKLVRVETGSGKRHYYYRTESPPGGRKLLAQNPPTSGKKKGRVAIEARADGCMTIAPVVRPTSIRMEIHTATSAAPSSTTFRCCRRGSGSSFIGFVAHSVVGLTTVNGLAVSTLPLNSPVDITRPGDDFNVNADWGKDVLEPIDFQLVREDDDGSQYWLRPGGNSQWSVRTGLTSRNGRDLMYVFSTNTDYFEPDRTYDKFSAYATVHHDGDMRAAAAALSRLDYGTNDEVREDCSGDQIVVTEFSRIKPRKVRWLWQDRIPIGKLTVLSGDPAVGKSFTFCEIAARVSTGTPFPDGATCLQGDVLIVSCEDDAGDTLRPRLEAHGANLNHVHSITVQTAEGEFQQLDVANHLPQLAEVLEQYPDTRLLVFDPLTAYLGKVDANSNTDVRRVLGPLCEMAQQHRVSVVGVSHLTKKETRAVARTLGSMAFVAAARANWVIFRDPKEPARRLFLQAKNNLADAPGLAFRIIDGRVEWDTEPVYDDVDIVSHQTKATPREKAEAFLEHELQDGPVTAKDVMTKAKRQGISLKTLRRAQKALGVKAKRMGAKSCWYLEEDAPAPAKKQCRETSR